MNRYYIAYGSNLNIEQMASRCPDAKNIGTIELPNYRLLFRGSYGNAHATIEKYKGYKVPVVIWTISERDERTLDCYEGAPRYYRKEYIVLKIDGELTDALVYIMNGRDLGAPNKHYYDVVKAGYESAGFDIGILETALAESTEKGARNNGLQIF
jgi:gamma-glutamylcyclotransferase (GGCT)/AIG2-like uncharacterized protein YtfP